MSVYQSNIVRYKAELKQTQYSNIDKRYSNQQIELKVPWVFLALLFFLDFECFFLNVYNG